MIDIKTRLKELREKRGYTQLKVAMDLSLNQNSVSRYENGEREADYLMLIAFADYYGVSVDYILYRTDNPKLNK
ncbi:MAG: helix-turn-helix domain-containing protein [Oscillospiraceae bacterium]|nr:helix-turn-helix domain-containing protein [Oscillospiraceae bacterium]